MSLTSPGPSFPSEASAGSESFSFSHLEGYDFEFDPPLDVKYECPICLSILKEPCQTNCGHRFCRDCIHRWLRESGKRCPIDNEALSQQNIFPDNFAKREILNSGVKCPNHKEGCKIVVTLSQLRTHLDECPLSLRPCPYNCASILHQGEMKEHVEKHCQLRLVSCPLCQNKVMAANLGEHALTCPRAPVQCQHCSKEIRRDEVERHIKEACENVKVPCPFHLLGCNFMNERRKEDDHLLAEIPSHMKQLSQVMSSLVHHLDSVTQQINKNGVTQNHNHSAVVAEMSRSISQLKMNSQRPIPQMSFPSSMSEHYLPGHQNWSNPVGNFQKYGSDSCSADGSPQSSLSDSGANRRISLPHSFVMVNGGSLSEKSCNRSKSSVVSVPQSASSNPGPPSFGHVSPPPAFPLTNGRQTVLPFSELSPVHNVSQNGILSSSPSSLSHPYAVNSSNGNQRFGLHSEGEKKIQMFVTALQELCIQQTEDLAHQQQLVQQMYHQLCETQKSNQDLTKQLRELESQRLHFDTRYHCGDFYWHIPKYSDLRKKALSGETSILHSSPFLTGPWGYKLCIRANISGLMNYDHEHYLSLFIHFMQGSNDTLLRWPFKGQIVLAVIDQNEVYSERKDIVETLEAKPHLEAFKQPTSARNHKGFGFTEFMSLSALEEGSFIRNDTIVIRAQVFPEK